MNQSGLVESTDLKPGQAPNESGTELNEFQRLHTQLLNLASLAPHIVKDHNAQQANQDQQPFDVQMEEMAEEERHEDATNLAIARIKQLELLLEGRHAFLDGIKEHFRKFSNFAPEAAVRVIEIEKNISYALVRQLQQLAGQKGVELSATDALELNFDEVYKTLGDYGLQLAVAANIALPPQGVARIMRWLESKPIARDAQ